MRMIFLIFAIAYYSPTFAQWGSIASPVSGLIFDVKFINDSVGFCAGNDGVLKTTDYGNTWNLINFSPSGSNLFFINETIGYLTSRNNNELYKSIDSGNTWQLNYNFSNETPEGVFFTSTNTGYVITSIYGPPGGSFIYKTTNGGINWTQTNSFPSIPTLQAITFTNSNTGFIVGYSGQIIKTNNAGTNWIVSQIPNTETLISVYFPDQMTGFAVGYSNISGSDVIKTIDSGNSWQNISSGGTFNSALRGVYFPTVNTGYAVGENGRIITTNDAGNTWITSNSGVLDDLYSTFFISNNGFAVGTAGKILKTTTNVSSNAFIDNLKKLKLYPNPTSNQLKIESKLDIKEITIIDLTGKSIKTKTTDLNIINVAQLPSGIYFIEVV
ncbi:MAG: hypothetical protein COA97_11925 [Flavobacteriales bacterium]|nr:MAG: hypothetical protein COA97_11925 [Flavobacteriales bacterium]